MCELYSFFHFRISISPLQSELTRDSQVIVSGPVVGCTLVLAFVPFLRALLWCAYQFITTFLLIQPGIYRLWLSTGLDSQKMMAKTERKVRKMRKDVEDQKRKRKGERALEQEAQEGSKATGESENGAKKKFKQRRKWQKRSPDPEAGTSGHDGEPAIMAGANGGGQVVRDATA
jgi:hypothetical protein